MSHYTVIAHLPADTTARNLSDRLDDLLRKYDENRQVEPRKNFTEGGPADFWWVRSVRRGAASLAAGETPSFRAEESGPWGGKVWSNQRGEHISVELAKADEIAGWKDDKLWAERLGAQPTWELVVQLYNEKYHPANQVAVPGEEAELDTERMHYDPESGRAYTWTTYNPDSKWDWWQIGGRWTGYFQAVRNDVGLIGGEPGVFGAPEQGPGIRADGGPKRLLDLEGMRTLAEVKAEREYDKWLEICSITPEAKSWSHFYGLVEVGEIDRDQAREQYNAQPRIAAAKSTELYDKYGFGPDPVERFGTTREEYVLLERNAAVPGYALITLDGGWVAAGEMGWFGTSSDGPGEKAAYHVAANKYIDEQVAEDDFLVLLDVHI